MSSPRSTEDDDVGMQADDVDAILQDIDLASDDGGDGDGSGDDGDVDAMLASIEGASRGGAGISASLRSELQQHELDAVESRRGEQAASDDAMIGEALALADATSQAVEGERKAAAAAERGSDGAEQAGAWQDGKAVPSALPEDSARPDSSLGRHEGGAGASAELGHDDGGSMGDDDDDDNDDDDDEALADPKAKRLDELRSRLRQTRRMAEQVQGGDDGVDPQGPLFDGEGLDPAEQASLEMEGVLDDIELLMRELAGGAGADVAGLERAIRGGRGRRFSATSFGSGEGAAGDEYASLASAAGLMLGRRMPSRGGASDDEEDADSLASEFRIGNILRDFAGSDSDASEDADLAEELLRRLAAGDGFAGRDAAPGDTAGGLSKEALEAVERSRAKRAAGSGAGGGGGAKRRGLAGLDGGGEEAAPPSDRAYAVRQLEAARAAARVVTGWHRRERLPVFGLSINARPRPAPPGPRSGVFVIVADDRSGPRTVARRPDADPESLGIAGDALGWSGPSSGADVASGEEAGAMRILSVPAVSEALSRSVAAGARGAGAPICVHAVGRLLVVGTTHGAALVFDSVSGTGLGVLVPSSAASRAGEQSPAATAVRLSSKADHLAVGYASGRVAVWALSLARARPGRRDGDSQPAAQRSGVQLLAKEVRVMDDLHEQPVARLGCSSSERGALELWSADRSGLLFVCSLAYRSILTTWSVTPQRILDRSKIGPILDAADVDTAACAPAVPADASADASSAAMAAAAAAGPPAGLRVVAAADRILAVASSKATFLLSRSRGWLTLCVWPRPPTAAPDALPVHAWTIGRVAGTRAGILGSRRRPPPGSQRGSAPRDAGFLPGVGFDAPVLARAWGRTVQLLQAQPPDGWPAAYCRHPPSGGRKRRQGAGRGHGDGGDGDGPADGDVSSGSDGDGDQEGGSDADDKDDDEDDDAAVRGARRRGRGGAPEQSPSTSQRSSPRLPGRAGRDAPPPGSPSKRRGGAAGGGSSAAGGSARERSSPARPGADSLAGAFLSSSSRDEEAAERLSFVVTDELEAPCAVLALAWVQPSLLAIFCKDTAVTFMDTATMQEVDAKSLRSLRIACSQVPLPRTDEAGSKGDRAAAAAAAGGRAAGGPPTAPSFAHTIVPRESPSDSGELLVLGTSALTKAVVQDWRERVNALMSAEELLPALTLAMLHHSAVRAESLARTRQLERVARALRASGARLTGELAPASLARRLAEPVDQSVQDSVEGVLVSFVERSHADLDDRGSKLETQRAEARAAAAAAARPADGPGADIDADPADRARAAAAVREVARSSERLDAHWRRLAEACTEFCVAVGSTRLLFGGVFARFAASGRAGWLLDTLEPYIMAGRLKALPPAVLQQWIAHCDAAGRTDAVQRCLVKLLPRDASAASPGALSLDSDSAVHLTARHGLWTAAVAVHNRNLDDPVAPVDLLLCASTPSHPHAATQLGPSDPTSAPMSAPLSGAGAEARTTRADVGRQLLLYLRWTLEGRSFPEGAPSRWARSRRGPLLRALLEENPPQAPPGGVGATGGRAGAGDASRQRESRRGRQFPDVPQSVLEGSVPLAVTGSHAEEEAGVGGAAGASGPTSAGASVAAVSDADADAARRSEAMLVSTLALSRGRRAIEELYDACPRLRYPRLAVLSLVDLRTLLFLLQPWAEGTAQDASVGEDEEDDDLRLGQDADAALGADADQQSGADGANRDAGGSSSDTDSSACMGSDDSETEGLWNAVDTVVAAMREAMAAASSAGAGAAAGGAGARSTALEGAGDDAGRRARAVVDASRGGVSERAAAAAKERARFVGPGARRVALSAARAVSLAEARERRRAERLESALAASRSGGSAGDADRSEAGAEAAAAAKPASGEAGSLPAGMARAATRRARNADAAATAAKARARGLVHATSRMGVLLSRFRRRAEEAGAVGALGIPGGGGGGGSGGGGGGGGSSASSVVLLPHSAAGSVRGAFSGPGSVLSRVFTGRSAAQSSAPSAGGRRGVAGAPPELAARSGPASSSFEARRRQRQAAASALPSPAAVLAAIVEGLLPLAPPPGTAADLHSAASGAGAGTDAGAGFGGRAGPGGAAGSAGGGKHVLVAVPASAAGADASGAAGAAAGMSRPLLSAAAADSLFLFLARVAVSDHASAASLDPKVAESVLRHLVLTTCAPSVAGAADAGAADSRAALLRLRRARATPAARALRRRQRLLVRLLRRHPPSPELAEELLPAAEQNRLHRVSVALHAGLGQLDLAVRAYLSDPNPAWCARVFRFVRREWRRASKTLAQATAEAAAARADGHGSTGAGAPAAAGAWAAGAPRGGSLLGTAGPGAAAASPEAAEARDHLRLLRQAVESELPRLVRADAEQAAVLAVWMLPREQDLHHVWSRLEEEPELLMRLMGKVVDSDVQRRDQQQREEAGAAGVEGHPRGGAAPASSFGILAAPGAYGSGYAADGSASASGGGGGGGGSGADGAQEEQLCADTTVADALRHRGVVPGPDTHLGYLQLLVRLRPRRVYSYLRSTDACRSSEALAEVSGRPEVADANAYLLERLARRQEALDLVAQTLRTQLEALRKAATSFARASRLGLTEEAQRARALREAGLVDDRGSASAGEGGPASAGGGAAPALGATAAASMADDGSGAGGGMAAVEEADAALARLARRIASECEATSKAARAVARVLRFSLHMCARASRAKAAEAPSLWFDLMGALADRERDMLRRRRPVPGASRAELELQRGGGSVSLARAGEAASAALQAAANNLGLLAAAQCAADAHSRTLGAMQRHLPLQEVLQRVLSQHETARFGRHRSLVVSMVANQRFETDLRRAATRLLAADVFSVSKAFFQAASRPVKPARAGGRGGAAAAEDGDDNGSAAGRRRASTLAMARGRAGTIAARGDVPELLDDPDDGFDEALLAEDQMTAGLARLDAQRRARVADAPLINVQRQLRHAPGTANVSSLKLHCGPPRRRDGAAARQQRREQMMSAAARR
ncbi:hypothetical protein FNF29_02417 [Cafeteria roenbergensis]|uniref:Vacuolar protein sorting-associated protein 8 central domain-containing protein n=1 Tax=Cafeteria roenbergensis TaxID=33653 RepID=A0A5A8CQR5_CAFRO|nr:hypothetical protein FNF29_02417 [Cafeteria roenbergensis]|eukprot:KAA0154540.1 hypothetical protein FNF29_02417 [Cafeteria roenbergensis]